jgi:hypothetical protein
MPSFFMRFRRVEGGTPNASAAHPAGFRRRAARSLYTDTAISLSTLERLVLLHIANLTIFEKLDLAPWRRLESRMRLFELT